MRTPTLYIMVGCSGSGKSTVARSIALSKDANIVSPDNWRKILCKDVNNQKKNKEVFTRAYDEMNRYLDNGYDVVWDATNTTTETRKRLLDNVMIECHVKFIYVNTTLEKALERVKSRDNGQVVPEQVVRRQYKQLQDSLDELFNNHFTVIIIKNNSDIDKEILDKVVFM